ncbi:glycosyl transferase [Sinomonas cellulolyticus]|uniref:Glycosyltransferase n=1 Tax=Sinomonas cellulolyticus TaxID=2801916 RepID=A0ABS1JZC0_9MICC|nr:MULTISPECIES: glycosyltransferase [Sinomonas]MBL0704690.1 glycosyltransferase [Sinomonas cellulolyticus]GHG46472.1 glycosyl transferase [Sinomonas sp. KCTC 49339]
MAEPAYEVAVVIPVRNGAETLGEQLRCLAQQQDAPAFEVVVADNGSTDSSAALALAWCGGRMPVRVVDAGARPGVAFARNTGVAAARGAAVAFCDADDHVSPRWVRAMADGLAEFDAVGGPVRLDRINAGPTIAGMETLSTGNRSVFGYLPYAVGASLGVRREVYLALGGTDESFPHGHEEVDFAWRLQHAGYSLGWAPDAVVDYRQRADTRGVFRQSFNYGESSLQLWARHAPTHSLAPVSLKGSIRNVAVQTLRAHRLLDPQARLVQARALGWNLGVLAGHLRYRKFGAPPAPRLMEQPSRLTEVAR